MHFFFFLYHPLTHMRIFVSIKSCQCQMQAMLRSVVWILISMETFHAKWRRSLPLSTQQPLEIHFKLWVSIKTMLLNVIFRLLPLPHKENRIRFKREHKKRKIIFPRAILTLLHHRFISSCLTLTWFNIAQGMEFYF